MIVRPYGDRDRAEWYRMRHMLWPEHTLEEFEVESVSLLACTDAAVFIAEAEGRAVGLAEVAIHTEAPGCVSDRIGFLEAWYVAPEYRRRGVGRALVQAAEDWARAKGCTEMASDTTADYPASPAAHRALGYTQTAGGFDFYKTL